MLGLLFEVRLGDCVEQIHLAFPDYTIEPLVNRLTAPIEPAAQKSEPGQPPASATAQTLRWNRNLDDVTLPITAEWNGIKISVRDIARLKTGDLLELSPDSVNQVQLRLGGAPKFIGRLGTREQRWGVEITQVFTKQRPVA